MNRRNVLGGLMGAGAFVAPAGLGWMAFAEKAPVSEMPPSGIYNPRSYGAKGDGKTKDHKAIQAAIDECTKRGGGVVLLTPGVYLSGTLRIRSNVNLHLQAGATILGSPDKEDYVSPDEMQKAIPWTVVRHLILAMNDTNVALTGQGTIDGSNQHFLRASKNPPTKPEDYWHRTMANTERITPISPMVEIACCNDVLIEGVTLQNAVGWTCRPIGCVHVVIRGVKVRNAPNTQNTDGIDPSSCENVMIEACDIDTGDDGLCIKSINPYSKLLITKNVTVTNCIISSACSAFKIGSEGYVGCQNITFSNSVVVSKPVREDARVIAAIDILSPDGGFLEDVTVSNITIRYARIPIWLRRQSNVGHTAVPMKSVVRRVMISDIQAFGAIVTSSILGVPGYPVEDVTLRNIRIQTDEAGKPEWSENKVPENETGYPEGTLFGRFPAFGLYCRHVKNLNISDMDVVSNKQDPRSMMHFEDVSELSIRNVTGTPSTAGREDLRLKNVQSAAITGHYPTSATKTFALVEGEKSAEISFFANDLYRAKKGVVVSAGVPAGAVRVEGVLVEG